MLSSWVLFLGNGLGRTHARKKRVELAKAENPRDQHCALPCCDWLLQHPSRWNLKEGAPRQGVRYLFKDAYDTQSSLSR